MLVSALTLPRYPPLVPLLMLAMCLQPLLLILAMIRPAPASPKQLPTPRVYSCHFFCEGHSTCSCRNHSWLGFYTLVRHTSCPLRCSSLSGLCRVLSKTFSGLLLIWRHSRTKEIFYNRCTCSASHSG
ncbi:unnamed protein product [Ectocarpus sp. 12 AP-2014]